jgi:hypothetical protein
VTDQSHTLCRPARELLSRARAVAMGSASSIATLIAAIVITGCGGSGGSVTVPKIAPARVYNLSGFLPATPVPAGHLTTVSFTIRQPSGQALTSYRTCCDPHAGVDLVIVRNDDSHVQYDDSAIAPNGTVTQHVMFPAPGRYRVVIDAYPQHTPANAPINFQLFTWITVKGTYRQRPLPPYRATQVVDGYRFQIQSHRPLKAIQAEFLTINVRDPAGHKAIFGTWHGALAHAIFIRHNSLDYFHTHVCSPGSHYCSSVLGANRVTGTSTAPGQLKVGVLLPEPGTWRLFLLTYINGHHITPTFTLNVGS